MRTFRFSTLNAYIRSVERGNALNFSSFRRNLAFSCLQEIESEFWHCEDFSDSLESLGQEDGRGKEDVRKSASSNSQTLKRKEDVATRITSTLLNRGWNLCFYGGLLIDLDDTNVSRMLNDLYSDSSDAALAFHFFNWAEKSIGSRHGILSMCTMINISVVGNMNYNAMKLLRNLVRINSGEDYWHCLLFNAIMRTCKNRQVMETVYSMLVNSCIDQIMPDLALKFLNWMKFVNIYPSVGVYTSLFQLLLKLKRMELAWNLFEEVQASGMSLTSIVSLFIHAYCTEGNIACASKLLFEMKSFGCEADIISYTILMDALCKRGLLKEATSLFYKIILFGLCPDSASVTSLIDAYCKSGKFAEAVEILGISGCHPDPFLYNCFMLKFCREGNMVEATRLLVKMLDSGISPDSVNYTAIIGGYCKIIALAAALKLLGEMLKRGIRPTVATYGLLIECYCKRGDFRGAEYLISMMEKDGVKPDIVVYNMIIDGYSKRGLLHKAFKWRDLMEKAKCVPDITTYNILIHGLMKRGFLSEVQQIVDELVRRGFCPDQFTFTSMIEAASKQGNFEEAYLIWCYMSENGMKPDVVTCSALLNVYCQSQQIEKAEALFQKMLEAGLVPDLILYNTLINGFCGEGKVVHACKLVNMMLEHGIAPNDVTYRALVHGFSKKGVENAEECATKKLFAMLVEKDIEVDESLRDTMGGPL